MKKELLLICLVVAMALLSLAVFSDQRVKPKRTEALRGNIGATPSLKSFTAGNGHIRDVADTVGKGRDGRTGKGEGHESSGCDLRDEPIWSGRR